MTVGPFARPVPVVNFRCASSRTRRSLYCPIEEGGDFRVARNRRWPQGHLAQTAHPAIAWAGSGQVGESNPKSLVPITAFSGWNAYELESSSFAGNVN